MTLPFPRTPRPTLALVLLTLAIGAPAAAQNQATPTANPAAAPTPTPLQRLDGYSLPPSARTTPTPTPGATPVPVPAPPVVTLPTVQPTPTPAPTAKRPRADPRRSAPAPATPAAPPPSKPTPAPIPSARSTRPVEPAPSAAADTPAAAIPTPAPTPNAVVMPDPAAPAPPPDPAVADRGGAWRWWSAALIAAGLAVAAIVAARRRRGAPGIDVSPPERQDPVPGPTLEPAPARIAVAALPPAVAPVAPVFRAAPAIDLVLRPGSAGLNLLSALVAGEIVVTNHGTDAIDQVQIGVGLVSAHAGQDADLAAFFAAPPGRPVIPAFTLAPGESRTVRIAAATARAAVQPMRAGNRPIFVPIVACLCRFVASGDPYRAARAFAVGIERVDSAKLAPIWLDVPPRMYDTVAARAHALPAGIV